MNLDAASGGAPVHQQLTSDAVVVGFRGGAGDQLTDEEEKM